MQVMPKTFIQTKTEPHLSEIRIGAKLEEVAAVCREKKYGKVALVCSKNTALHAKRIAAALCLEKIPFSQIEISDGEKNKTALNALSLCEKLQSAGMDRHSAVVAVGGGVLGDVAGFAASVHFRGIPVVQVPTTLLSMVDSSVGGKTGVNLSQGKNTLGTFHPADAVVIDFSTLDSLPAHEYRQGLAEIVKAGLIADSNLFDVCEKEHEKILARDPAMLGQIVNAAIKVKKDIVEKDPHESISNQSENSRKLLNLGHSAGHGIESLSGYSIPHGDAVAIGMVAACKASESACGFKPEDTQRVVRVLSAFGLPVSMQMKPEDLAERMKKDKKNVSGSITLVLLRSIGKATIVPDVPQETVVVALRKITA
ncbi:MAG: 3-dehydroquinate synthase [Candidatus Micrarchaeia archaeon]|jgi:3-dehydroquinate synthase